MPSRSALFWTAIFEILTGVALLVVPALVIRLLLGGEPEPGALQVARVAGLALVGLGIACWPGPPIAGMLVYGIGVALGLAMLGITGAASGVLLWPAVLLHLVLIAAMVAGLMKRRG